ncbi:ABC transporter substrate-binding protein [Ideonella paludis]|uniref:ABC transporter substrate-binding protein n=1 Tax=Ideonella paludis TaxID=1233411 RepID=A0ABS5DV21_9BURK|nr:ABC transporter substrate-binding protein [Ideonella paludis]MBQ0934716.1 ABC transporter substrate-binding protein [Ideonella paludis]
MRPRSDRRRVLQGMLGLTAASATKQTWAAPPKDVIRLGQSVPISGAAQHLGIEYQRGLQMAFNLANASGGVQGRSIELISLDDAYEADMAAANTQDLIGAEAVFALVGYVGAESVRRSLPLALKAGVPMIAPLCGAEFLRQAPPRALITWRAGQAAELALIVRTLSTMGWDRMAVLQQTDADGEAGLLALQQVLQAAKLPAPVTLAKVARNSTGESALGQNDIAPAAKQLLEAKPQVVVSLAAYGSTGAVWRALRKSGFRGGCYGTSLSGSGALAAQLGSDAAGLSLTQVVPSPTDASRPVVASYLQRLKAADAKPEHASLEGWMVGQTILEALRRMPRNGTREQFLAALESLGTWDMGGFALKWDPARRQLAQHVSLTVYDQSGRARH